MPIWPENIDANTETSTRMKTTSANIPSVIDVRKRRASGYASPRRTDERPLRDRPIAVADRLLVLRGEHDRRADEHETLDDEQQHVDVDVERDRDRNRRDRPHEHDRADRGVDDRAREVARQHRRDADEHEHRTEHQRQERRAQPRRPRSASSPIAAAAMPR